MCRRLRTCLGFIVRSSPRKGRVFFGRPYFSYRDVALTDGGLSETRLVTYRSLFTKVDRPGDKGVDRSKTPTKVIMTGRTVHFPLFPRTVCHSRVSTIIDP